MSVSPGDKVTVMLGNSRETDHKKDAVVIAIRSNGTRVQYADGKRGTVAWWRLNKREG